jgi:hypothetical protein
MCTTFSSHLKDQNLKCLTNCILDNKSSSLSSSNTQINDTQKFEPKKEQESSKTTSLMNSALENRFDKLNRKLEKTHKVREINSYKNEKILLL